MIRICQKGLSGNKTCDSKTTYEMSNWLYRKRQKQATLALDG